MPDQLNYIDNYFTGTPTAEEKAEFEKRLTTESDFAAEVSLYLATLQVLKEDIAEEKKKRFREIYKKETPVRNISPVRKLRPYLSVAAALVAVMLGWYLFMSPASPQEMAEKYVSEKFETLGVKMGSEDDLQKGLQLYNEGNFSAALQQYEKMISLDSSDFEAKKYAGIVCLRLNQFDKSLYYFRKLENQKGVFANPGLFYQAITLMKRNLPGDNQQAQKLLQQVVSMNLDGKETAQKWLNNW